MKLIHTADWHLGKNIEGHSRLEEQRLFLKDFINICEEEQADIIIIAGDIYDNYNPSAMAEQLFYDTLKQLSRNGDCMTVVIAGNHDNPERLVASGPLARDHGIVMAGTPNSVITPGMYGKNEITESDVGYIHAIIHGEEADILLVHFPSEKRLNEVYLDETEEETKKAASYSEKMSSLFGSLATHFHEDSIHLIASHLFVMNSVEDGSERSIQLGGSYMVGGEIFPENADYIALGHIHLPAELAKDRMYYAGSLEPTDKNDTGKHGYIKGEIKNGRTQTEFIPFASREYVHMEVEAGREMTGREMKEKISLAIRERGIQNIYKIILRGFRDPDMIYDTDRMDSYGNIVEILDETKPAYDYEKLKKQNAGNLLGWYIESFAEAKDDSVEAIALAEGVQAMLEAKGSKL